MLGGGWLMRCGCCFPGTCRNCHCRLSTVLCPPSSLSCGRRDSAHHSWAVKLRFAHPEVSLRVPRQTSEPKQVHSASAGAWDFPPLQHIRRVPGGRASLLWSTMPWGTNSGISPPSDFETFFVGSLKLGDLPAWPRDPVKTSLRKQHSWFHS